MTQTPPGGPATSEFRFGSDHGALRSEDEPLLTGRGRFTDDLNVPGQAYAVFVRAPVSHAEIRSVELGAARAMPGVLGVFTGRDLAADGLGAHPAGRGLSRPRRQADVRGRDAAARASTASAMSASPSRSWSRETLAQALDAAEQVALDLDELPAAPDVERATAAGRDRDLHEARPATSRSTGPTAMRPPSTRRSRGAAHVERVRLADTRLAPVSLEPRAGIGLWDAAERALHADRQHAGRRGGAQAAGRRRVQGAARRRSACSPTTSAAASA